MKTFIKYFICVVFLGFPTVIYSQNIHLNITTQKAANTNVINSLNYTKIHNSFEEATSVIDSVSQKLVIKGYINSTYSINRTDSVVNCVFTLNDKIEKIRIHYNNEFITKEIISKFTKNVNNSYFEIPIEKTEQTLNYIVNYFEKKGYSFSTIQIKNIRQENTHIVSDLVFKKSEKRTINKVVVKGYENFPEKYLNRYLEINNDLTFSKKRLSSISKLISSIPFITQLKKPEILFSKDSTILYIYVSKKSINRFDGLIGFTNNTAGKIKLNGYLNLELNNSFNKGEVIKLNWQSTNTKTSNLNLTYSSPFIFNSKFNLFGSFSLFKQDTVYTTASLQFKLNYNITKNHAINGLLENENSNTSSNSTILQDFNSFKKKLFGLTYSFNENFNSHTLKQNELYFETGILIGNKTVDKVSEEQTKLQLKTSYLLNLNKRNRIFIKSTNEILNSKSVLQNELFRLGGIQSIRGFDELSILTSKYSITNLEYHFITFNPSYIYSITDVGFLQSNFNNKLVNLISLGVGYQFYSNNSIINLSYAIGKYDNNSFNLNNSKVHIKISYLF